MAEVDWRTLPVDKKRQLVDILTAKRAKAVRERWPTPGALAVELDPTTKNPAHLQLIDSALVDVLDGKCLRLIVTLSPQEGKSERISHYGAEWLLLCNPDLRIVVASYEVETARRWGQIIRNDLMAYKLPATLQEDSRAAGRWQIQGHKGGVYATGVAAALTGRAVDCIRGDTMITTESGYTSVHDLALSGLRPRVLSLNHATGRTEWRPIRAVRSIPNRPLIEVITTSGRRIACTPDHRIYTENGYRAASVLRPGDRLIVERAECDAGLRGMWQGAPQYQGSNLFRLLQRGTSLDIHDYGMHVLRRIFYDNAGRSRETAQERPAKLFLLSSVLHGQLTDDGASVSKVREAYPVKRPWPQILFTRLSTSSIRFAQKAKDVSALLRGIYLRQKCKSKVLFDRLRRCGTLFTDDRQRKLQLQNRDIVRRVVQANASVDSDQGQSYLRSLQTAGRTIDGSSCGRDSGQQYTGESSHAVPDVSRGTSQIESDTVAVVRRLRGERDTVYDLDVEGNHNFFAGQILVHNCLLIDDPIKDREQADSEVYRERLWNWWTDVARTRLAPNGVVVIISTRWHQEDLTGRILQSEGAHEWRHLNIPAQCESADDPLGRQIGEFLPSAREWPEGRWQQVRRDVGERTWNALYQGRPSSAQGDVWKREWWRRFHTPLWTDKEDGSRHVLESPEGLPPPVVMASWDMAFKDLRTSDFVVGQVWVKVGANAYLVDQVCERLDFPASVLAVRAQRLRWPQITSTLIEDKANGPAVIASLKQTVPGLIAINPHGSKMARAAAVAPFIEAGNVWLPSDKMASWTAGFIEQSAAFPNATNDDQVDACSQALDRLFLHGRSRILV